MNEFLLPIRKWHRYEGIMFCLSPTCCKPVLAQVTNEKQYKHCSECGSAELASVPPPELTEEQWSTIIQQGDEQ